MRSTGLSRAAPDLMDSQICREEEEHQGRSQGLLPPPSQEHPGAAGQRAFLPTGPAHSSRAPCRDTGKSKGILSLAGLSVKEETRPVRALVTAFHRYLLNVNYRTSTSGIQKKEAQSPPSRS